MPDDSLLPTIYEIVFTIDKMKYHPQVSIQIEIGIKIIHGYANT